MDRLWMAVTPSNSETRLLAMAGPSLVVLKARLNHQPAHPRALPFLLESLALWQNQRVDAVLSVDANAPIYQFGLADPIGGSTTPLYTLDFALVDSLRRLRTIDGLGSFADLQRLLTTELAR
jgi:hypothetical protein